MLVLVKIIIMKKTLLFASLLFASHYVANAQQNISFETTEGYSTGALHGQNGWTVEDDEDGGTGSNNVIISAEQHSNGAYSLKFAADEEDNALLYDIYKLVTPGATTFSISQDIYIDGLDVESGSDLGFATVDIQGDNRIPTSAFSFVYDGTIEVLSAYNPIEDEYDSEQVGTFEDQTWYHIKSTFNLTAGTVQYYLNNALVFTATLPAGQMVDAISYQFDAYATSFYADNVVISTDVAGIDKVVAAKFSVFPNPATNVVSVATTNNAIVNNITVTDLNGRIVTTANFNGVTEAQINIAQLSAGIYMMNITSDKGTAIKKIVKQ